MTTRAPGRSGEASDGIVPCIRFLRDVLGAHRWGVGLAGVLMLLSAAVVLAIGFGASHLIDSGAIGAPNALFRTGLPVVLSGIVLAAVMFSRDHAIARVGETIAADLRRAIFDTLLSLPPDYFERVQAGDVLTRLTVDVARVQEFVGANLFKAMRSSVSLCAALVIVLVLDAGLAAVIAGLAAAVVLLVALIGGAEKRLAHVAQTRFAALVGFGEQSIGTIKTVQMFVREDDERLRFAALLADASAAALVSKRRKLLSMAAGLILAVAAGSVATGFGAHQISTGAHTAGALTSFLMFVALIIVSAGTLLDAWGEFQSTAAAMARIQDLLDQGRTASAPTGTVGLIDAPRGAVRFDQVSFCYPARPDQRVLDRISFALAPGEAVAVIGESGSGKSTLLDLLGRFLAPGEGVIAVDGVDVATVDPRQLRRLIGVVPQDPVILGADVWDNLRIGRPDASEREIRAAADMAHATPFVEALPQGFATVLGENGACLSGGQRQRLALARVMLRDPAILLLDEATSALDPETARMVGARIAAFARTRTTIAVTHNPAVARLFERIIVLRDGWIAGDGSHAQLLRDNPFYRRFAGAPPVTSMAQPSTAA